MKWPHLAPNSRRNTARALTNATLALVSGDRGRPPEADLRKALTAWSFNVRISGSGAAARGGAGGDVAGAQHPGGRRPRRAGSRALGARRPRPCAIDGSPARPDGAAGARACWSTSPSTRSSAELLAPQPVHPTAAEGAADRRRGGPAGRGRPGAGSGPARGGGRAEAERAVAGGVLRGHVLRGAAARLRHRRCARRTSLLPAEGWGELLLESSTPEAGASWTDSGRRREERQLKHRAKGETRIVPCPPALTALLHAHLTEHGTAPDGRLFRGVRGGELAESTYCRVWRKARVQALTAAEAASPLAGRPYDLRHAAVSTWLNAGVPVDPGRGVGRPQPGGAAADLRQVPRGPGGGRARRIDAVLGGSDG